MFVLNLILWVFFHVPQRPLGCAALLLLLSTHIIIIITIIIEYITRTHYALTTFTSLWRNKKNYACTVECDYASSSIYFIHRILSHRNVFRRITSNHTLYLCIVRFFFFISSFGWLVTSIRLYVVCVFHQRRRERTLIWRNLLLNWVQRDYHHCKYMHVHCDASRR